MERYRGQNLNPAPHVAVVFTDKIGAFAVVTPLLRGLKEKYPRSTLDYFGGERTKELEEASRFIDSRYSLYGRADGLLELNGYVEERVSVAGRYELCINCESDSIAALATTTTRPRFFVGNAQDIKTRAEYPLPLDGVDRLLSESWIDPGLVSKYRDFIRTPYIAEIFCALARVSTDVYKLEIPQASPPRSIRVPPVLVALGSTRSAKLWPRRFWREVVEWCVSAGLQVGLLGANRVIQHKYYNSVADEDALVALGGVTDLRGKMTLPEVAGVLSQAALCITVDNGISHLAAGVGLPTIGLYGASASAVWAPRRPNFWAIESDSRCDLCARNRFQNVACLLAYHECMEAILPSKVIETAAGCLHIPLRS